MELFAADGHDAGGCERVTGKSGMRPCHDLGGRYLANRDKQRVTQSLLRRLRNLGVEVEVKAA